ncbi:PotD/PotF family extracellular solute-binding protein [Bosea sp. BH3]|uniref:ABC transporter substrate-binding protein n=1 Tax=Bosea sp. BH3 TaxID=2871701 RepID=UPI0021CB1D11|nr:extracellular solute-binding protein [Bosea sp. BH3]MCU4180406.1 extracellular solute-binding protein [Bosea sp. BH3]
MAITFNQRIATALAFGVSLVAPGAALAQQACSSMQVLLGIAPNHREHVMEFIAPKLKQKFNVDLVAEAIGSAAMVERVQAQVADPRISIAQWDAPIGLTACERGLCKPIDFTKAPNAKGLSDWAVTKLADGQPYVLATNVLGVGIIYDEEQFKKNKLPIPTSWADLQRPEMKGRLAITAPQSTMGTAALVMLAKLDKGGEKNIEPGFATTKKILPNVHTVFTWTSELSNLMQLGEVWAAVTSSNIAPAMRSQGIPMKFVLPKEGSPTVNGGLSMIKGGPCEDAAYEYVNLYYSDEFQVLRMRKGGTASPTKTSWDKLSAEEKSGMGITAADFEKLVDFDWKAINDARPGWIERWQREIR